MSSSETAPMAMEFSVTTPHPQRKVSIVYTASVFACKGLSATLHSNELGDRRGFNETLFLSMKYHVNRTNTRSATWKLTLSPTLRYYELPNKKRGDTFGPLLDKDPLGKCNYPSVMGSSSAICQIFSTNYTSFCRKEPSSRTLHGYDKYGIVTLI
jgi:hypothetical protein